MKICCGEGALVMEAHRQEAGNRRSFTTTTKRGIHFRILASISITIYLDYENSSFFVSRLLIIPSIDNQISPYILGSSERLRGSGKQPNLGSYVSRAFACTFKK